MTNMTICQCLTLTGDDETMTQRAELQIAVQNTALVFISEGKKRSARCRFFSATCQNQRSQNAPPHTHTPGQRLLGGSRKCLEMHAYTMPEDSLP